ncbi:MAG: sigma 54-interacting transcriptional regulator [Bacteroidia bacterium]|nr:sigma 54-interacting transcriptional regulator [Bacteroidia bacterium]
MKIVFASEEIKAVLAQLEQVAATDATVLVQGETGTGKELIAHSIHKLSSRADHPMVRVNCSAIPRDLIESELFGHIKGAFTGAIRDKKGKFELAEGGTIFLDEIGELPLSLQPKLLRALQEREIEKVGGSAPVKINVRVVAATNKVLIREVEAGNFRDDLYFRLNVFPLLIPPLRERPDDIPILIRHFIAKFNDKYGKNIRFISDEALEYLHAHPWPGNVRELENTIERSVILSGDEYLLFPEAPGSHFAQPLQNLIPTLNEVIRMHILKALKVSDWKIEGPVGAARILGIKPSTLRDRMRKMGIGRPKT